MEVHYKPTGSYLKCCMLYRQLNIKNRLQGFPSFYPEAWCFITKSCCWKAWGREEPTQKDALLINCLSTVWISWVEIGVCLGLRDRKVIKFKISVDRTKSVSKTSALDIRTADFRLLRELVIKIPWKNVFACAGVHQCGSLFKHQHIRAQEQN